ncbi:MAG TPA: M23 family metallopeptidase [Candidatus Omnitrophota bacterium]|nr:M23 family metallopeptidase [Candidatus Omnitrophota bacterium]
MSSFLKSLAPVAAFLVLMLLAGKASATIDVFAHGEVFQGRSFMVFIVPTADTPTAETPSGASLTFNGHKINFFPNGKGLRAIVGCEPEIKTGEYPIKVEYTDVSGNVSTREIAISVSPRTYPKVSFWLRPAKHKLLAPVLVDDEWGRIEKILLKESPVKRWDGFFLRPTTGITTMYFGTQEFVNGKPRSRHRGQDFRAAVGMPIFAAHNGKVVVAQFFKAFGGTVVIDHGQGIDTLYFHLSKIIAAPGQEIKKGETLGLSGDTGITSGPHLHWGMSVHDIRVDPMQWVETVIP